MSRLFIALTFICLVPSSFPYDRRSAEEELSFLSQNAQTYLTEILIWVAVISVLIFALILCICDLAVHMLFDSCCAKKREKVVDVEKGEAYSKRLSLSGEGYYLNVPNVPSLTNVRRSIIV